MDVNICPSISYQFIAQHTEISFLSFWGKYSHDSQDLEIQCEDAVFELCDARERYPTRCGEELGKYLRVINKIAMEPVLLKPTHQDFELPFRVVLPKTKITWNDKSEKLLTMVDRIRELTVIVKQLQDNKNYEIKHHLK